MILFVGDIIIGFLTSYINVSSGDDITNLKMIAINYIFHGTFFLDIFSTFPLEVIFADIGSETLITGL
jgi:hypothetical protein